nr:amidohydrolase family protein [Gemmatimonadales bacterium]
VLARRHPSVNFLLAHIGGGGDWLHSLPVLRDLPNVLVDLSGSGVDGGMLEACLEAVGVERLLWGCDLTIETGWAKLRYLEHLLSPDEIELVRWGNAARIFPTGTFPAD